MVDKKHKTEHYFQQHFKKYDVIKNKFRIEKLIGVGGFGQVYKAIDLKYKFFVAIKVCLSFRNPERMILEQKILHKLNGTSHSPAFLASGSFNNYMYIVLELLGRSLSDLRRNLLPQRFTVATTFRVGQQCIEALKNIHEIGFIHRDLKPSNICIGAKPFNKKIIYVIDFGISRHFRDVNGKIRNKRIYAGFRGTTRYVSINVHNRQEQGPVDDFWSLLYSLIEMGEGLLPWRFIHSAETIKKIKTTTKIIDMCYYLPKKLNTFSEYLDTLAYNQMPNYTRLNYLLKNSIPENINLKTPYDWE